MPVAFFGKGRFRSGQDVTREGCSRTGDEKVMCTAAAHKRDCDRDQNNMGGGVNVNGTRTFDIMGN